MEDNVYARAITVAPVVRDPATQSSSPWFSLRAMFLASLLATPLAGSLMIAWNCRVRGDRALSWVLAAAAVALIAPATMFVDLAVMAVGYNHDSREMPCAMGLLLSLQAAVVAAVGRVLQGDELRARRQLGLPMQSWWVACAVAAFAMAWSLICLPVYSFAARLAA
ncbi:hypothetical protein bcgnr5380_60590 [Bacillus cereus]